MLAYRTEGLIAWATLDRPDKLNAMTRGFWQELRELLARAEDDETRVSSSTAPAAASPLAATSRASAS